VTPEERQRLLITEGREWFSIAVALDAENRQLRRWLTDLLIWISRRQELLEHARALADQRWPDRRSR
jgi:hypothetical protein